MEALYAHSDAVHDVAATTMSAQGGGLEPTLYSIGIVICFALLLLWYGMVRRPG